MVSHHCQNWGGNCRNPYVIHVPSYAHVMGISPLLSASRKKDKASKNSSATWYHGKPVLLAIPGYERPIHNYNTPMNYYYHMSMLKSDYILPVSLLLTILDQAYTISFFFLHAKGMVCEKKYLK